MFGDTMDNVFWGIEEQDLESLFKCLNARKLSFNKGSTVLNNANNTNMLCIVKSGLVDIIRIDYNGNKSIIDYIEKGNVFESKMYNLSNNEIVVEAAEDSTLIFIEYDRVINRCKKNCNYHNKFIDNLLSMITKKLNTSYERIQILTKKTIREKLLEYFKILSDKKGKNTFKIPMKYMELAEYLSIDRSAMLRELKVLKEDKIITQKSTKIITLNI